MSADPNELVANFATATEARIVKELGLKQTDRHAEIAAVTDTSGAAKGYVRCYEGKHIYKFAVLSIDVAPGARYFNMHIMPEPAFDMPRFLFEGMCSIHGNQVSTDILFDQDMQINIRELAERCRPFEHIYKEVREGDELNVEPSRQAHMRALASPYFLCVFSMPADKLAPMEAVANRYLDEWLKLYASAGQLSEAEAADRLKRRNHMADMVIELDPDRNMVVQVLGEDTVQAIERAVMY